MSLDTTTLQNVRVRGAKTTARCPGCAEAGHDQKGEHLVINADDSFGCVVYPGDSAEAKEHRKRIFALCGDREIKPLIVRSPVLGRLGRVNRSQLVSQPLKTGLLGRLGRLFETHLDGDQRSKDDKTHSADYQLNECEKGVLSVPNHSSTPPDRPLTENERALLIQWCGTDNAPSIILEARRLFSATIVEIESADEKLHVGPDWVQMDLLDGPARRVSPISVKAAHTVSCQMRGRNCRRLSYAEPSAASSAIGYAMHSSRSHCAVIRVYDAAGNVIETHQHKGDFKEW